jgi:hypothetical protein
LEFDYSSNADPTDYRPFFTLTANGGTLHGEFDSGASFTNINLVAAHVFGITKRTPGARLTAPGEAGQYRSYPGQKVWAVPPGSLTLSVGSHPLTPTPIFIYQHMARENDDHDAVLNLGLESIRDRVLVVSYSTRRVCVGKPSATPPPPVARVPAAVGVDTTQVLFTTEALTNMTSLWTAWMNEPLAVRDTGRRHHQVSLHVALGTLAHQQYALPSVVDMNAMAAHYPSVAADLTHAHLTAHQWDQYRRALFSATLTEQSLQAQGDTTTIPVPPSVTGTNIAFLRAHAPTLAALKASGMWFPTFVESHDYGGDLDP